MACGTKRCEIDLNRIDHKTALLGGDSLMKKFLRELILSDKFSDVLAYIAGALMLIGVIGIFILMPN
jgi:hypothetical protein